MGTEPKVADFYFSYMTKANRMCDKIDSISISYNLTGTLFAVMEKYANQMYEENEEKDSKRKIWNLILIYMYTRIETIKAISIYVYEWCSLEKKKKKTHKITVFAKFQARQNNVAKWKWNHRPTASVEKQWVGYFHFNALSTKTCQYVQMVSRWMCMNSNKKKSIGQFTEIFFFSYFFCFVLVVGNNFDYWTFNGMTPHSDSIEN